MLRRPFSVSTMSLVSTVCLIVTCCTGAVFAGEVMFGGVGGHGPGSTSTNDGALVTIDQSTGQTTLIGHPAGVARLTGIAFDSSGAGGSGTGSLFGSTIGAIPFPPPPQQTTSTLIRIDPATGALISNIGSILNPAGSAISIADLAAQPSTGALFGIQAELDGLGGGGNLYTIDKSNGHATLIGNTGHAFGSLAFAPDGTLYMTAADHGANGPPANPQLLTLDPATAATLTSVPTAGFFGALGARPSDGVLFAGNGDESQLFTLDPATGAASPLSGSTGTDFVGDIDFHSAATAIPLPAGVWTGSLMLLCLAGAITIQRRSARPRPRPQA
jgi:hypothetical protein